jgi:hypothetical protein
MDFDKLTEQEKQQYISEAVKTHFEYEPSFNNFEKFKSEIESSEYNEYIEWESKFLKQSKDAGYIGSNSKIQGETCDFCLMYNEHKIFESQSKLLKHLTTCKYNPNNLKNKNNIVYECIYCNKQMGNKHNLEQHELKCANNSINTDNFSEMLCQYCSQYCKTKIKKHTHELRCIQNPMVIEKLTCKTCNKFMMNEYNLNIHTIKCIPTVKCQYCQKVLKSQLLMPTHLENCDSYIAYLQNLQAPINLDDIPDVNLNTLIKNALK